MEREALLGGGPDVEAGAAPAGKKQRRSWLTLVGVAARYMWPDSFWLQVGVLGVGGGGLTSRFSHQQQTSGAGSGSALERQRCGRCGPPLQAPAAQRHRSWPACPA